MPQAPYSTFGYQIWTPKYQRRILANHQQRLVEDRRRHEAKNHGRVSCAEWNSTNRYSFHICDQSSSCRKGSTCIKRIYTSSIGGCRTAQCSSSLESKAQSQINYSGWMETCSFRKCRHLRSASTQSVSWEKGLASRAKYQFPDMYVVYQDVCKNKALVMGKPYLYKREASLDEDLADEPFSLPNLNANNGSCCFPQRNTGKRCSDPQGIEQACNGFWKITRRRAFNP